MARCPRPPAMMPSPCRKPSASSKSAPGVRMVDDRRGCDVSGQLEPDLERLLVAEPVQSGLRDPTASKQRTRAGPEERCAQTRKVHVDIRFGGEGSGWAWPRTTPLHLRAVPSEGFAHSRAFGPPACAASPNALASRPPQTLQGSRLPWTTGHRILHLPEPCEEREHRGSVRGQCLRRPRRRGRCGRPRGPR